MCISTSGAWRCILCFNAGYRPNRVSIHRDGCHPINEFSQCIGIILQLVPHETHCGGQCQIESVGAVCSVDVAIGLICVWLDVAQCTAL